MRPGLGAPLSSTSRCDPEVCFRGASTVAGRAALVRCFVMAERLTSGRCGWGAPSRGDSPPRSQAVLPHRQLWANRTACPPSTFQGSGVIMPAGGYTFFGRRFIAAGFTRALGSSLPVFGNGVLAVAAAKGTREGDQYSGARFGKF